MASSKRREVPILTRVESEVMGILWRAPEGATVHDVVAAMPRAVAYTSVLTVLRILEKKGYVEHAAHPEGGRAHLYRPVVAAQNARRQHVRDLVERLFGGHSGELLVGLIEDEAVSREELERLRGMIDDRLGGEQDAAGRSRPAAQDIPGNTVGNSAGNGSSNKGGSRGR